MSNKSKMLICVIITFSIVLGGLTMAGSAFAKPGGGKGGGNAGSGNGGEDEPVYSAAGELINEPDAGYINSTNLSFDDIIFRSSAGFTMDLSGFAVNGPNGACVNFSSTTTGTLVLAPGDSANPGSAELRFGFQGLLSDGSKTEQHYLIMNGEMFDEYGSPEYDWPPSGTNLATATELIFTDWSISAEKRNAQNKDCDGNGESDLNDPYAIIYIWNSSP